MSSLFAHHVESEQAHVPAALHSPEWSTPQDLFERLHAEFRFDLDVCASAGNAKCAEFYTRSDDGLQQDWAGRRCWMNPPYGRGAGGSAGAGKRIVRLVARLCDAGRRAVSARPGALRRGNRHANVFKRGDNLPPALQMLWARGAA